MPSIIRIFQVGVSSSSVTKTTSWWFKVQSTENSNAIHYNLLYLIIFFNAHSSFIPQYTCLHWKIRYQSFITQRLSLITHANTPAFFELCKWNYLWVITQHCLCTGGILSPYRDNFLRSLADICVLITQSIAWKSIFMSSFSCFLWKTV